MIAAALVGSACSNDEGGSGDEARNREEQPAEPELRTVSGGVDIGPADERIDGVEAFRIDSNAHTDDDLAYPAPPAGGEHNPVPATCGFYEGDPPPDEMHVHDLEHGAVWIAYDPGLDAAQLTTLRDLVADQAKVTATPYPGVDAPLVVSAWGRQLRLDDAGDPRLLAFVEQYRNSSNSPEPTAACQGAGDPTVVSPPG